MSAEDLARDHYRRRRTLAESLGRLVRRLWAAIDPADLDVGWARTAPQVTAGLLGAQLAAARQADAYVDAMLLEQGADPAGDPIAAAAFTGASDGRDLEGLLRNPITVVKAGIAGGATVDRAMAAGYANLDMLTRTQLADAGRAADQVALVARPAATGYVRMLNPPSCSRCVVLAGRRYEWNAGFLRHPRCDCIHVPVAETVPDDVRVNPKAYFDSLSQAEQDKAFTAAGARAIRDGADLGQVVNARRGAAGLTPAGARITGEEARLLRGGREVGRLQAQRLFGQDLFVTTEGTTVRGVAGRGLGAREDGVRLPGRRYRSARPPRLMPESIYQIAGGDRDEALRLLRRNGYLLDRPSSAPSSSAKQQQPDQGRPAVALPRRTPQQPPPTEPPTPRWETEGRRPRIGELIPRDDMESFHRRSEIREALMAVVDGDYGNFHVEVIGEMVQVSKDRLGFTAIIFHQGGGIAGRVERTFYRGTRDGYDPDALWAEHVFLQLERRVQGQGFAELWNARLEQWYRESGLSHIGIHADIDVGGYAWARQGFDFEDEEGAEHALGRLRDVQRKMEARAERIRRFLRGEADFDDEDLDDAIDYDLDDDGELSDTSVDYVFRDDLDHADRPALEALLQQLNQEIDAAERILEAYVREVFGSVGFPTPNDIAMAGRRPGQGRGDMWIGKWAMLDSDWMGVKWLR